MAKKKTGNKKAYYTAQRAVSARNKAAGLKRRARRLNVWIAKGVTKKGKPVLTLEVRKTRARERKAERDAQRMERRNKWRQEQAAWAKLNPGRKPYHKDRRFKPIKDDNE